jgi:hypothetical protein
MEPSGSDAEIVKVTFKGAVPNIGVAPMSQLGGWFPTPPFSFDKFTYIATTEAVTIRMTRAMTTISLRLPID